MAISVLDLFSIGIGPSSSHTVGPMRAARRFVLDLQSKQLLSKLVHLRVELYGSLALTGKGHATDLAILLGLQGYTPEGVDPDQAPLIVQKARDKHKISILNEHPISFTEPEDLVFNYDKVLPYHPNGMRFTAYDEKHQMLLQEVFYSVGGGFIVDHASTTNPSGFDSSGRAIPPYPFNTADELLAHCRKLGTSIAELMRLNERTWHTDEELDQRLLLIWHTMHASIIRGYHQTGVLPGGLNVPRRAPALWKTLQALEDHESHPAEIMEWLSLWALSVNEENAAGGRVVTAPTNGSAGVIPSVMNYYHEKVIGSNDAGIITFMLTAGAIGILFKKGASISAAEMGCMGEVGVACSMAAGGLAAVLGGSNEQIENAAEIGIEHNLGLTCDPIKGLVQIPCIERNTMGAIKAVNAAYLALRGDGTHKVSLDQAIATMRQTGNDMKSIYKETSQGGLAVNVPEC